MNRIREYQEEHEELEAAAIILTISLCGVVLILTVGIICGIE